MGGEALVKVSIWLALSAYGPALAAALAGRRVARWQRVARWSSTVGLVAFWIHVVAAFAVYYGWSHQVALRETARATEAMTGRSSDVGLWLNYLFTVAWTADVVWWWRVGCARYRRRNRWLASAWHGFFLFMVVNGAVVFERGAVRWVTVVALLALAVVAIVAVARRTGQGPEGGDCVGNNDRRSALSVGRQ